MMDMREQEEMKSLGLFGIYTEAYKIILSRKKIFTQITLALILPLSVILLSHIQVSVLLMPGIIHHYQTEIEQAGTRRYEKLFSHMISEYLTPWHAFTPLFFLTFSLHPTLAVVNTIACIYTDRKVTFKRVMRGVPKVWKRLVLTFLCTLLAFFAYSIFAYGLLSAIFLIMWAIGIGRRNTQLVVICIILTIYGLGLLYMTIVWQLASAVSVLEDCYGFKAMVKSKNLIKGKMWVAIVIFFMLNFSSLGICTIFVKFFVLGESLSLLYRFGFGGLCLSLHTILFLFGLIVQTVIYFVCKSYHHENIDKSALSDHLEVNFGEHVPLKETDVKLEQFQV